MRRPGADFIFDETVGIRAKSRFTTQFLIGCRFAGSSSMMEISRSPYKIIASVRGIGVALMTSTCGSPPFLLSISRCATPKRCCSSVITNGQIVVHHFFLNQRVGSNHDICLMIFNRLSGKPFFLAVIEPVRSTGRYVIPSDANIRHRLANGGAPVPPSAPSVPPDIHLPPACSNARIAHNRLTRTNVALNQSGHDMPAQTNRRTPPGLPFSVPRSEHMGGALPPTPFPQKT